MRQMMLRRNMRSRWTLDNTVMKKEKSRMRIGHL